MNSILMDIANAAHQIGGVTAMAAVCLVQYVWHVSARKRLRRQYEQLQESLNATEGALSESHDQKGLIQFENRILCDLLLEPDPEIASRRLLQAFVSWSEQGVAGFFGRDDGWRLRAAIGVSAEDSRHISIDPRLVGGLAQVASLVLDRKQLDGTQLGRQMRAACGRPLEQLYFFRATPPDEPLDGIVMTSALPDCGGGVANRIRITERLLAVAGRQFRRTATAAAQEQELRITREILELRSLVDLEFHSPQAMVEQFLNRLTTVVDFEHASVYLLRRKDNVLTRLARFVSPSMEEKQTLWGDLELRIAQAAMEDTVLRFHTTEDLERRHIRAPFQTCVTVPMRYTGAPAGMLCLSGMRGATLGEADQELLAWAGEYLLETILKSLDRASMEERAHQDSLTGLGNRGAFDIAIEHNVEMAARIGRECSLILLDLDAFKQVNDQYGHQAGDETLRTVAQLIQDELRLQLRGTDRSMAARYGGEELAIILPAIGINAAWRVADAIRRRVEEMQITTQGSTFSVTLSGGVASAPLQASTVPELITAADAALYRAKLEGRNRILRAESDLISPPADLLVQAEAV